MNPLLTYLDILCDQLDAANAPKHCALPLATSEYMALNEYLITQPYFRPIIFVGGSLTINYNGRTFFVIEIEMTDKKDSRPCYHFPCYNSTCARHGCIAG